MSPCAACGCHVRAADASCPHCGAGRRSGHTAAAALLGLALGAVASAGCEPEYGATVTADEIVHTPTGDTGGTAETGDTADETAR